MKNTEIPGQMSIFDLLPAESLENIPEEEMVIQIGNALGVTFVKDKHLGDYRAKVGQSVLSVEYSYYDGCFNDAKFISCGVDDKKNHCGSGAPRDSIKEAIEWFERRRRA